MSNANQTWRALLLAALLLPCTSAWAQWELNSDRSSVNFVSIKNDSVGEVHSFTSMVGFIGEGGNAQVAIDLDSVDTLVDIRNQRMRELLFETAKFPAAQINAQVEPSVLAAAAEGGVLTIDLPIVLSLHGLEQKILAPLVVAGEDNGRLRVHSARPLLINAADFGLVAGVEALREIAGLQGISNAVPVTLNLTFVPVQ